MGLVPPPRKNFTHLNYPFTPLLKHFKKHYFYLEGGSKIIFSGRGYEAPWRTPKIGEPQIVHYYQYETIRHRFISLYIFQLNNALINNINKYTDPVPNHQIQVYQV